MLNQNRFRRVFYFDFCDLSNRVVPVMNSLKNVEIGINNSVLQFGHKTTDLQITS